MVTVRQKQWWTGEHNITWTERIVWIGGATYKHDTDSDGLVLQASNCKHSLQKNINCYSEMLFMFWIHKILLSNAFLTILCLEDICTFFP